MATAIVTIKINDPTKSSEELEEQLYDTQWERKLGLARNSVVRISCDFPISDEAEVEAEIRHGLRK